MPASLALPAAVVVLATLTGLLAWGWTVAACQREAAEDRAAAWSARAGALERAMHPARRMLRALADLVADR